MSNDQITISIEIKREGKPGIVWFQTSASEILFLQKGGKGFIDLLFDPKQGSALVETLASEMDKNFKPIHGEGLKC